MILGNECTRACRFCDVKSSKSPLPVDLGEPARLAQAVVDMKLRHVVITAVARDDLADGGAAQFARCLHAVRAEVTQHRDDEGDLTLEVLTSDFEGNEKAIELVVNACPHVFNHNLETVERLIPRVRSKATYQRSLQVLSYAKRFAKENGIPIKTKSGIMVGLGEELDEVRQAIGDLRAAGVDILTVGQYLRPSEWHLPVFRFVSPNEFAELKAAALALGFSHVEAGPLVRSSYHAEVGARVGTQPGLGS
jgi:lipoic acid synthetase